ncbi:hypothetical protein HS088_TW21G00446 [Tripterygium wilfordii]|uniref:VQ domain-containing protein n=1 Tax=Tripterygium wilfordii TaxID=458696 RepID=A0A7J7C2A6_TRIWF|nr:VQ motif-containing protein 4-like [Tripterygium wilfordii]KAF5728299.1 hypothetical protein HS088_TW21G00446 [Tripterygium wilfordii]
MENTIVQEINRNPSPVTSPNSNGSSGVGQQVQIHTPSLPPIPISRSHETNPYPTTFVQADSTNFKQVVQLLTGSSETAKQASKPPQDPSQPPPPPPQTTKNFIPPKKQSFKLYERRNSNNNSFKSNSLMINTLNFFSNNSMNNSPGFSPRKPEILSPSILDFPKLTLSPVTPLTEDPFNKSSSSVGNYSSPEEEKAIAEKGFYFHPSPMSTPRDYEPQLLPLFPVTSPRVSDE